MPDKEQLRLISNHSLVLLHLAQHPRATYREIAGVIGMTERHAVRIVRDLEASGVLYRKRVGVNNAYTVDLSAPLPNSRAPGVSVRQMIETLTRLAGDSPGAVG